MVIYMRQLLKAVYGCVPRAFPQTSLSGEYAAMSAAYDLGAGITLNVDCQDLFRTFDIGIGKALQGRSPHACSWKFITSRNPNWADAVVGIKKVKAHKALSEVGSAPGDFAKWLGNSDADKYAKLGASLHEPRGRGSGELQRQQRYLVNISELHD